MKTEIQKLSNKLNKSIDRAQSLAQEWGENSLHARRALDRVDEIRHQLETTREAGQI